MQDLVVQVITDDGDRPPQGSVVIVQVRDTSRMDDAARVLSEVRSAVGSDPVLAIVRLRVDPRATPADIWALVDVDDDGRISHGDYVTVESYPVHADTTQLRVVVKKVR